MPAVSIRQSRTLNIILAGVFSASTARISAKTFKYSEDESPTNFDPLQDATIYTNKIVTAIYDTLYEYRYLKVPYEIKPALAEEMPQVSKDLLTYTVKLKKDVRFADDPAFKDGKGREVTAQDFVYSMMRHFDSKNISQGAWLWSDRIKGLDDWKKSGKSDYSKTVEGLKALDSHTVQIILTKPYPQLVYTLAMGQSAVVPREAVDKYGREFSVKPVGSGPFKLVSHTSSKTILEKNLNYREDKFDLKAEGFNTAVHARLGLENLDGKNLPIVDRVELSWMNQPIARWNSLSKGNEILWSSLQPEQMEQVLASSNPVKLKPEFEKKFNHRVARELGLVFTFFNMDKPDFGYNKDPKRNEANKALRCAIRKSFNWKTRIDRFYLGLGEAFPGFIHPDLAGFSKSLSRESVTFDLQGAKALLAKHGWTPETLPTIEYAGTTSVQTIQFFEQFRGFMTALGFPKEKIKHKAFANFGDFNKYQKEGKADLIPMGWGYDYPDAENTLAMFYGPNHTPGSNMSNTNIPEYNKLYQHASQMLESPARTAIYEKLNELIVQECSAISSFARTRVFLWHKNAVIWPQREVIGNVFKYLDLQ